MNAIDNAPHRYDLESHLASLIDNISVGMFSDPLACILMYRDYSFACALKDKSEPFIGTEIAKVYLTEVALYDNLKDFKINEINPDDMLVHMTTDMFAINAVEILLERARRIKE